MKIDSKRQYLMIPIFKMEKKMLTGELNLVKLCKLLMRQIYRHCV